MRRSWGSRRSTSPPSRWGGKLSMSWTLHFLIQHWWWHLMWLSGLECSLGNRSRREPKGTAVHSQDLTFSGYSWFKWSGNSLIDYHKNAREKQPFSGFCQMQRASGEGIGFDSWCAILHSIKGEIKRKGSPGEAASAAEQHGACSVDVCSRGTGCVLSLCSFLFPSGEHLPFPCSSVCEIRPLLVQKLRRGCRQH